MRKAMAVVLLSCLGAPSFAADDVARLVPLMAKVGSPSSPSFSPDGKTLAFWCSVLSGLPQVWTVPVAGGYPELVTAFDDPSAPSVVAGRPMARVLARPGRRRMNAQVYVVKPNGTGVRMLTAGGRSQPLCWGTGAATASPSPFFLSRRTPRRWTPTT